MRILHQLTVTAITCFLASHALATSPKNAPSPYDGKYESAKSELDLQHSAPGCRGAVLILSALNIVGGTIKVELSVPKFAAHAQLAGKVDSSGTVVLHGVNNYNGPYISGDIDANGRLQGQLHGQYCLFNIAWQRRRPR
jgi:hypothetical protein